MIIRLQQNHMKISKRLKALVKMADFFYSSQMLRYQDQMQYRTLTGGIISLGIIITILIGFASMIIDTLNLSTITTSMQVIKNDIPTLMTVTADPQKNFMFAFQIWRLNLSSTVRYFDISFQNILESNGIVYETVTVQLETCTREHWAGFTQIINGFDHLGVGGWLCPAINSVFNFAGKYSSPDYSQYTISVSKCQNGSNPSRPCAPDDQIKALFDQNQYFYFTIYFINTIINSDQKSYKSYYLQDKSYVIFGQSVGSQTYLYLTDYQINSDYSIWPFTNIQIDQGCIVQDLAISHPYPTTFQGTYLTFNLAKSSNTINYNRQVQKISSVFSFMGGMIGAISAILFIIKVYTSLAFEISLALEVFKPKDDKQIHYDHLTMNFFTFIKYNCYKLMLAIGKTVSWPAMTYVSTCQKQIMKQLDIKSIIRRIIFIQHCLTHLFEDDQLDGLQLKKPTSPEDIKRIRMKCESILDCDDEELQTQNQNQFKSTDKKLQELSQMRLDSSRESPHPLAKHCKKSTSIVTSANGKGLQKMMNQNIQMIIVQMISDEPVERQRKCSISNSFKNVKKRQTYKNALSKRVAQGDAISSRIWKGIDFNADDID